MTTERRKAIITISATLLIGILIGSLASGLWSRKYYGQRIERGRNEMKMDFEKKVLKVVDADETQAATLGPILKQTMLHVDSVQSKTDGQVRILLDSLDEKLKSVLRDDQYKKFKKFVSKVKGQKKRDGDKHRGVEYKRE